jgi:hypothetical protein
MGIAMTRVKLCLIACVALGFPFASAYADDASYCEALSTKYRTIAGNAQVDATAAEAMAQCKAGNTAAGIPVLEKFLKDNKATLPPRT